MTDVSGLTGWLLESLPGSLRAAGELITAADWSRSGHHDSQSFRHGSGLRLDVSCRVHEHGLEWASSLTNESNETSPLVEELRPCDLTLPSPSRASVSTVNGSLCQLDDFLAWQQDLTSIPLSLEPTGGRSSDGTAPFFTLSTESISIAVAIGWSGQWRADLSAADGHVRVAAGLADACLRLEPGEQITLPSFMITVGRDRVEAENRLRRTIDEKVIPHADDGTAVTPLAHMTMSTFHQTHQVSEASELAAVDHAASLGLEAFWVDACWYGDTPRWAEQVGNWAVRTEAFPRGLRPISDAAHRAGMQFVLWIEPERARAGTALATEHPDLFLPFPDQPDSLLLDLGNPDARAVTLELICTRIDEFAVDIYRQDFNIRPLDAWRAADEPQRAGIHEIRHVEGLYWLWDQLRDRHPGLVIDNCASGGRRIDLETLRRSVPLWRSDAADVGGGAAGDQVSVANQIQVSGLSRFVTQHTGPIWAFDPYAVRSAIGSGFVVYCPLPTEPEDCSDLRAAVTEFQRLRPIVTQGDLHVLVTPSVTPDSWSVLQYHRAGVGDGLIVALRRPGSTTSMVDIVAAGIDVDATYSVQIATSYQLPEPMTMAGSSLARLAIEIQASPGSCLVEYARLD